MSKLREQNILQAQAAKECQCPDAEIILRHGASFRSIINECNAEHGRDPTIAELIWCASERVKHNIRDEG